MLDGITRKFEFYQLLLQVFFVGMTVGLFRTIIPALAESKFNIPENSFLLLGTFVAVFGVIKAILNFVAGRLSDSFGRRRILLSGWVIAIPIPYLLANASSWSWILCATFLLGMNQGLCWSMSQTMKLDLSSPKRYGIAVGLNETLGYCGVALTGYLSAVMTTAYGLSITMLSLGFGTISLALILGLLFCKETLPVIASGQKKAHIDSALFYETSWRNRATMALCVAGLVEKFVDTLVWLIYPMFLYKKGISLPMIGVITGVYALVWGLVQLSTGLWSDRIGRKPLIVVGMILCAISCSLTVWSLNTTWWIMNAVIIGVGMALLYPTLSAAISDQVREEQRGTVLGIYRFWRDFGYFIGAIVLSGAIILTQEPKAAFYLTSICMLLSAWLLIVLTPETHTSRE